MSLQKIWKLLNSFKDSCRSRGWVTSKSEDWVKIGDKYHNFVLVHSAYPSTFKRITFNRKFAIREGVSYRVVETEYLAWVLSTSPDQSLWDFIYENPEILIRTAVYDLSPIPKGKPLCLKLNATKSAVFKEFENFLQKRGVKLKPFPSMQKQKDYTVVLPQH